MYILKATGTVLILVLLIGAATLKGAAKLAASGSCICNNKGYKGY
jgi:hypothetical protein